MRRVPVTVRSLSARVSVRGPALSRAVRPPLSLEGTPLSAGEGRRQARDQRDQKH